MKKYDKSLTEVWEWKEKVHQGMKGIPLGECIKKIKSRTDKVLSQNHIKLISVSQNSKQHQTVS